MSFHRVIRKKIKRLHAVVLNRSVSKRRTNGGLGIGDVHTNAVIRVGSDDDRAVLRVKRKIGDVDVARRLEYTSRLPVQSAVMSQHHADALEVRY